MVDGDDSDGDIARAFRAPDPLDLVSHGRDASLSATDLDRISEGGATAPFRAPDLTDETQLSRGLLFPPVLSEVDDGPNLWDSSSFDGLARVPVAPLPYSLPVKSRSYLLPVVMGAVVLGAATYFLFRPSAAAPPQKPAIVVSYNNCVALERPEIGKAYTPNLETRAKKAIETGTPSSLRELVGSQCRRAYDATKIDCSGRYEIELGEKIGLPRHLLISFTKKMKTLYQGKFTTPCK